MPKTPLPAVSGELKRYIRNYVIKYREGIESFTDNELANAEELNLLQEETKSFIREKCAQATVKSQLRNPHKYIIEHKEETIYRKKRDRALKRASFSPSYYSKVKSEYRENNPILPLSVSDVNINRAYRLMDAIITTLDDMEAYTTLRKDSSKDIGAFHIMHASFQITVNEQTRKTKNKDNKEHVPELILTLIPESWFGFSKKTQPAMIYQDHDNEPMEVQVGKIIYDMFVVANKLQVMDELEKREERRKEEERERQRRLKKMREGELEEVKLLTQASKDWAKAQKIRSFADSMECKITELDDQEKQEKLRKWLKWARDKADWLDPLTAKSDELLGGNQHIFDVILAKFEENR
ncbi:hypothetical protein [uncultured Anaeromusa sp.]|uniref:hypothetical protein n=1 Tax=uncultured Anaeromusa sp. TaxID=673273 RepID=UPI0029C8943E|nr:hypothetical protein [uncultured Anaeromusa sp.]